MIWHSLTDLDVPVELLTILYFLQINMYIYMYIFIYILVGWPQINGKFGECVISIENTHTHTTFFFNIEQSPNMQVLLHVVAAAHCELLW